MKEKKWFRQYGIHIVICAVIIAVAFGINEKINLDRSHVYSISEGIYTMLKDVTKAEVNGGKLELAGWCFDTEVYNESSRSELILQDTETGEALWPKMEKEPETPKIAERYTDGGDYSGAGFAGSLKAGELQEESVYEILVRYTTDYTDENGNAQQYVRTVSTDAFLYQGEITEYNPKTFVTPEIAGTELAKELEGARLFHWFEEGMWVYCTKEKLYYVAQKECVDLGVELGIPCFWYVQCTGGLPEELKEQKSGNVGFRLSYNEMQYPDLSGYRVWCVELPYRDVTCITTGLYNEETSQWIFRKTKQLK